MADISQATITLRVRRIWRVRALLWLAAALLPLLPRTDLRARLASRAYRFAVSLLRFEYQSGRRWRRMREDC